MLTLLLFFVTSISLSSCYNGYTEITEDNVPGKIKELVTVQKDAVIITVAKNKNNNEIGDFLFSVEDPSRPRFEFTIKLVDECAEDTAIHFGKDAQLSFSKSHVDFDVSLTGPNFRAQTVRNTKEGTVVVETGLESALTRASLDRGTPAPSGSIDIDKIAIALKPTFKAVRPPCTMEITVLNAKVYVKEELLNF